MKTNKPLEDSEVHEGPFSRDKAAHPRRGHPITRDSSMPGNTYVGRERQGRETYCRFPLRDQLPTSS